MARTLNPLYGDYINDTLIARAGVIRPGFAVVPTFTNVAGPSDNRTITLVPDASLGIFAWKTRWVQGQGSFTIIEDASIAVNSLNTSGVPYQLLVARWKWVAGPLDVSGHPTGVYVSAMDPVYQFEAGVLGDMTDDALATTITQPDVNGRYGTVLGVLNHGVFSFLPATMLDPAALATQHLPIAAHFISLTLAGTGGSPTHLSWAGSTVNSTGDAPTINGSGDIVINRAGFYEITGLVQEDAGGSITSDYQVKLNGTPIGPSGNAAGALYLYPYLWAGQLAAGDIITMTYGTNASGGANAFFTFKRI